MSLDFPELQFLMKTWKTEVGSFVLKDLHPVVEKSRAE